MNPMKRIRIFLAAVIVAGAAASVALAQHADPNTAGPTKNDYRLRVVEPASGAVITGPTVRVVVDTRTLPEVGGEKRDTDSMPRPDVQVFLDNEVKGTLKAEQNVLTIDNVPAGEHKLVFVATNRSGEIIDREEVPFRSELATSARAASAPAAPAAPAPAPAPAYRAPAPAPAPAPETQAHQAAPPPSMSTHESRTAEMTSTLPKTASADPLLVVGGLALIAAGLFARRSTLA
jgi:LPXTG-motif cell wall-anchored protein